MRTTLRLVMAALIVAALPFTSALGAPPTYNLSPGGSATWEGPASPGVNTNYHDNHGTGVAQVDNEVRKVQPVGKCSTDATTYCDTRLVVISNPVPETDADGKLTKSAAFTVRNAKGDVDLMIYASDASGARGDLVGSSTGPNTTNTSLDENVSVSVITTRPTVAKPTQPEVSTRYYLVDVVYYAAAGYTGGVTF